jgi:creatine kinase
MDFDLTMLNNNDNDNPISLEDRTKLMEELLCKCKNVLTQNPSNLCCKYAVEYLSSEKGNNTSDKIGTCAFRCLLALSFHMEIIDFCRRKNRLCDFCDFVCENILTFASDLAKFYKCIKTGIENSDSKLGCYATSPSDYSEFRPFFDAIIRDYHGDKTGTEKHVTDWTASTKGDVYDLSSIGLGDLSMRVRVGRNLEDFNLPASMTKAMRIDFEKKMLSVFDQLKTKYGGTYYSLSPDLGGEANPNLISEERYNELVAEHVMFKDMSSDLYLNSAGISNDWPYGRGCWQSEDKMRVIWVGEEDQLRIMCMKNSCNLLHVFENLKEMLDTIETIEGIKFASHEDYGYITSCPSNLGTGMRASVHIQVPSLTFDGQDALLKHLCKPLGLSVRGTGGEHTPIKDGLVDISPASRLFVSEGDIVASLFEGIKYIKQIEDKISTFLGINAGIIADKRNDSNACVEGERAGADEVVVEGRNPEESLRSQEDLSARTGFVLVENTPRDSDEKKTIQKDIETMKKKMKSMKVQYVCDRSMLSQSPRSLNLSPSSMLQLTNA